MAPLFVSHGSPMLVLEATPSTAFLKSLGERVGKPKAVVAVSAHWETQAPRVGAAAAPATIHDFRGFPQALFDMRYPAPGAPDLAARVAQATGAVLDGERGLDHGIWCVAKLMWPDADVPIVPLSVQPGRSAAEHYELGTRLRGLDALVLATGALTHNLRAYFGHSVDDRPEDWCVAFADWMAEAVAHNRVDDLLDWQAKAPFAARNHPTAEHLLPLFVALGAGQNGPGRVLHRATEYGVLAMDAYEFG